MMISTPILVFLMASSPIDDRNSTGKFQLMQKTLIAMTSFSYAASSANSFSSILLLSVNFIQALNGRQKNRANTATDWKRFRSQSKIF